MQASRAVLTSFATAVVLCLATASVWAKSKVAVAPFQGDSNGKIRDGVAEAIEGEDFSVIDKRETKRAADKVELEGISDKMAKNLAFDLGADVLVLGEVTKKAGKTTLKVLLYVDGKKAKGFSIQFRNVGSADFQKALRATLKKKVEAAGGGGEDEEEPAAEEEEEAPPKKPKRGEDEESEATGEDEEDPLGGKKTKKAKRPAGEDEDEEATAEDEDEPTSKKKKKKKKRSAEDDLEEEELDEEIEAPLEREAPHQPNRAAVRVDLGLSAANRSLRFTSRSNFPEAPRDYQNSPVPGARIELELYPFAFSKPRSVAAGLGIAAEFDRTLGLNLETTAEPGTKIPTKQQHWAIGARFRLLFGKRATSPGLTLGFNYGRRSFIPDTAPLADPASLDLPETDYTYVSPSVSLRVPFVKQVALVAGGEGMAVMKAGQIQTAESYGKAKIIGFEAFGGLDFVFTPRIALRVTGEFTQFGYNFVGTGGEMTNNRDGDPATKDVGGAEDRSIGGVATLAVIY